MAYVECEDCGEDIDEYYDCAFCAAWEDEPKEFED